jgi:hypothetical protein
MILSLTWIALMFNGIRTIIAVMHKLSTHFRRGLADSHLFITVLAYQFVQLIRRCLKESGTNSNSSWRTLREIMSTQCRVTASFRRADGKALHVRKATRAEPEQMSIYRALKVNPAPGGISKTIV